MSHDDFRAYLKEEGSNPEIDSFYYELSSHELIHGIWNCEILTLGFVKGESYSDLRFRPKNTDKPIVFAIDGVSSSGYHFVKVDAHLDADNFGGMHNYKTFKTGEFLIDCSDSYGTNKPQYWAVKKDGMTFVYINRRSSGFPGTWRLDDCDLLCALIGGGITANELRAKAYREKREKVNETRREERLQNLMTERRALQSKLESLASGFWPFINKSSIAGIIDKYF